MNRLIQCKSRLLSRAQSRWGFQRGEAAALPFGRTRGFKPRVRYNLISCLIFLSSCGLNDPYTHTLRMFSYSMRGDDLIGGYYFTARNQGRLKVDLPDGEILNGNFTHVLDATSPESRGSQIIKQRGFTGRAFLRGDKGTTMQCQYSGSGLTGRAFGICKTNSGKQYSLQLLGEQAS